MRATWTTFAFLIAGCATHFETGPLGSRTTLPDGIVYYQPKMYLVTYHFRSQLDSSGNVNENCTPMRQKQELQFLPDFDNPRYIVNKPSEFGTSKFSIGLTNGVLTTLGSESTPQANQLISSLIKPIDVGPSAKAAAGEKACNAGPVISEIRPCDTPAACATK